jgi:LAS superfamily LD-carboxypeptidase LdcB
VIVARHKTETLSPYFKPYIDWLLDYADQQGVAVTVISAHRTNEEQAEAARQARAAGRPAAAPGRSAHQYGLAVDLMAGKNSGSAEHEWLMKVGRAMGFRFYANDRPHFEHPAWAALRQTLR